LQLLATAHISVSTVVMIRNYRTGTNNMFITSNTTGDNYFWIKIPRTGTVSYQELFIGIDATSEQFEHSHFRYGEIHCTDVEASLFQSPGFTLVRNPMSRFISGLQFIKKTMNVYDLKNLKNIIEVKSQCPFCKKETVNMVEKTKFAASYNIFDFLKTEDIFYDFMYSNFDKNCHLKNGAQFEEIFRVSDASFVRSFFQTQVYWAYHPKVKVFKYEEIDKFNNWIKETLGYDTTKLNIKNSSSTFDLPFDTNSNKFKKLVKHLFYDDFRYFNYEFPI